MAPTLCARGSTGNTRRILRLVQTPEWRFADGRHVAGAGGARTGMACCDRASQRDGCSRTSKVGREVGLHIGYRIMTTVRAVLDK